MEGIRKKLDYNNTDSIYVGINIDGVDIEEIECVEYQRIINGIRLKKKYAEQMKGKDWYLYYNVKSKQRKTKNNEQDYVIEERCF